MNINFSLPDIVNADLSNDKERRKIIEYLYQLTEQLRFMLSNIDEDNLSDKLKDEIKSQEGLSQLSQRLEDTQAGVASVRKQTAAGFEQVVKKGEVLSAISQSAEAIKIAANKIKFEGLVTANGTFMIFTDGSIICTGGQLGGFTISEGKLTASGFILNAASGTIEFLGGDAYMSAVGGMLQITHTKPTGGILLNATALQLGSSANDVVNVPGELNVEGELIVGGVSIDPQALGGGAIGGQGLCGYVWGSIPGAGGIPSSYALTASDAGSTGYIIKTRYSSGWQWCIDGASGSTTASWIAIPTA